MTSSTISPTHETIHSFSHPKQQRPIVLIGLMGAGKTTVGRRLAKQLGYDFVDSDAEIELAAACSISDIFAIHGEPIFRDLEKRVIRRLLDRHNIVIATGGGAWIQADVREMILQKGLSIWLKADVQTLLDRVEKRDHRPLLEQGDKRTILSGLIEQRYPIYRSADITIESGEGAHELVVEKVIHAIATQPKKDECE